MSEQPNEAEKVDTGAVRGAAEQMKAAREAAGLSLADVAHRTRVPLRHLASLEEGDYGALPGMTYVAGFARAYARAVGLDEADLVSQLRGEVSQMGGLGQDPYEFEEAVNPNRIPPRWLAWTAALLALLLAGGYALWRMQINTPPTDAQVEEQRQRDMAMQAPPTNNRPAAPPPAAPTGPVVLTAADDVWLRIYEKGGERLFEGTLARGQSYTVPAEAREPLILTGRPDALAVTVGGQAIPPLGTAERTISDVPVTAAALLARARQPVGVEEAVPGAPSPGASSNASGPVQPRGPTVSAIPPAAANSAAP